MCSKNVLQNVGTQCRWTKAFPIVKCNVVSGKYLLPSIMSFGTILPLKIVAEIPGEAQVKKGKHTINIGFSF